MRFCLTSGEEAANRRNLPYAAGMAVAHGLDHEDAPACDDAGTAEILGIAEKYGSLQTGKSATLFIADGDILDMTTHIEQAWIGGRSIDLNNKQLDLERRLPGKVPTTQRTQGLKACLDTLIQWGFPQNLRFL